MDFIRPVAFATGLMCALGAAQAGILVDDQALAGEQQGEHWLGYGRTHSDSTRRSSTTPAIASGSWGTGTAASRSGRARC